MLNTPDALVNYFRPWPMERGVARFINFQIHEGYYVPTPRLAISGSYLSREM
jgi:hypothetical protein